MSPSNFPATNPEVIRTAIRTRSASLATGMQNLIEDLQKGRITRVDESAFEIGRNLAVHARSGRVRERADPAHSIYAADGRGRENAALDRPALHQQVLSARSRRGQLVRRICRCPGSSGVPDFVAQRSYRDAISDLGRLPESRAAEGHRRRARHCRGRPSSCAGILRRRHHPELCRRRAGRARRRQACDHDACSPR